MNRKQYEETQHEANQLFSLELKSQNVKSKFYVLKIIENL